MKIHSRKRGSTGLAYGLLIGLISITALSAITSAGDSVDNLMTGVAGKLEGTAQAEAASPTPTPLTGTRIFITDQYSTGGNLGGLSGADAKCAADIEKPDDGRTYIAFLSTSGQAATERVSITYPVRVASDPETIVAQSNLFSSEFNYPLTGWGRWTGMTSSGGTYADRTCNDWTSNSGYDGAIGNGNSQPFNNGFPYACGSYGFKWYCISTTP